MKAITRNKYGSSDVLSIKEIPKPIPKTNEILVRVHSTTVNRTDCGILTGKPWLIRAFTGLLKPSFSIPGTDFAGQVEAIGSEVSNFEVGDRVWGFNDAGLASHAEYLVIQHNQAIEKIPDHFSYNEAVACAEGAHYALNFINKVSLSSTDKVLVNGATGAIGSAALQLLKSMGIFVTAVGNTKNLELLKTLGADKVYNYETEDFTQLDKEKYDFIFDAAGRSSFGKCRMLLQPKGIYISSELGPGAENLYLPLITKIKGGQRVIFPIPKDCPKSVSHLTALMERKEFQAVIDRRYTPEEIADAYAYVQSGQKTGNVIINF
ncbi:MAG: NADPH:quinone reductase-like Zn-dependent oxidoreductase [Bacteroidia bacterium]|jgi:NADPH:quinone reductase-like Zn-dependent oxidoreductase